MSGGVSEPGVLLTNLAWFTSDADVDRVVRDVAGVSPARVDMLDDFEGCRPLGAAVVNLPSSSDANTCRDALNGHSLSHRRVSATDATPVNVRAVQGNRSDLRSQLIASLGLNAPSSSAAPHSYFQPPSAGRGIAPGAAQNGRAVTHPPGIPAGVVPPPSEPPPQQQQQAPPPQVPPPSQKLSLQDPPQPLQLQSQPLQQQTQQQSGQKRQGMVDQSAETADASKQQRQQ